MTAKRHNQSVCRKMIISGNMIMSRNMIIYLLNPKAAAPHIVTCRVTADDVITFPQVWRLFSPLGG